MANVEKIIRKGLSNKKDYLLHKLKNGMKCMLISQPDNGCKTTTNIKREFTASSDTSTDENDDSLTDESYSSDEEETQKNSIFFHAAKIVTPQFFIPMLRVIASTQ